MSIKHRIKMKEEINPNGPERPGVSNRISIQIKTNLLKKKLKEVIDKNQIMGRRIRQIIRRKQQF